MHFQVCSPYTYPPPKAKNHHQLEEHGDSGRTVPLYPPWGSNSPVRDGRGACCPLYYDKIQQLGTVLLSHTVRPLSRSNTKTLATARDTPCGPPLPTCLMPPPGHVGTGAVGGVPAGPGWPAHPPAHFPPPRYDYTHGAKGWGLPSHPPLPEAGAIGQSSGKDDPATFNAGGASGFHRTYLLSVTTRKACPLGTTLSAAMHADSSALFTVCTSPSRGCAILRGSSGPNQTPYPANPK